MNRLNQRYSSGLLSIPSGNIFELVQDTMDFNEESLEFLSKLLSCEKVADENGLDILDCKEFWRSENVVEWFECRGYVTYTRSSQGAFCDSPRLPYEEYSESDYPFAYHQADDDLAARDMTGKFVFAQDSEQRHVAIKLTRIGSEEYRIMRFLQEQSVEDMQRYCILPILELLHCREACFVVMPRWGSAIYLPHTNTMGGLLFIMQSMLKALAFLHSNNIIHRDLNMSNMVVNFFGNALSTAEGGYYPLRQAHLSRGLLSYALIDFDLSIMAPPEIRKEDFRLHREESWVGTYSPTDTLQGEFDYNPFAYDVGTLGAVFCQSYQRYTADIPMLAPFLDRMVTRDIKKRFTAAQALGFLDDIIKNTPAAQLSILEDPDPYSRPTGHYEDYDRWKGLPADFQKRWAAYREPIEVPLSWKLLRAIRSIRWLPESLIPNLRWFISRALSYLKSY